MENWARILIERHSKILIEYLDSLKDKPDWVGFFVVNHPIFLNKFQDLIIVGEYELPNQKYIRQSFVIHIKKNKIIESDKLHKRDFRASIFVIVNRLVDGYKRNLKEFYNDLLIYDRDCRTVLEGDYFKASKIDYIQPLHPDLNGNPTYVSGQGFGSNIVHVSIKELRNYSLG